jgi:hypothetical protein
VLYKLFFPFILVLLDEKEVASYDSIVFRFTLAQVGNTWDSYLEGFYGWSAVQSLIDRETCICYCHELDHWNKDPIGIYVVK